MMVPNPTTNLQYTTNENPQPTSRTAKPSPLGYTPFTAPQQPQPRPNPRRTSTNFTSLPAPQLAQLRESFNILDKDSDGLITPEDLSAMLASLGLDTSHSTITHYLPTGPLNLAAYLTTLSSALSDFSPPEELLAAFAAFDEHDDGCVDVDELATALMGIGERMSSRDVDRALSGFTRRRGLGGGRSGEVFRYQEFVNVIGGGKGAEEGME